MSGRILAGLLVLEPKSSLKCSLAALVSGTKLRFSKKKFTFSPLFRGSLWKLITHHHCCRGIWGELPQAGREGASACSGGWVAGAEMPFPWFKAPACGENFPADAGAQRGAQRGAPRRGAARPDIATSRHARTVDREGEREPLRPAAKRGSAPACNDR